MSKVIRVSLPTYDALTDTNVDHYALYTDQDNILIKEKARGSVNSNYGDRSTIAHGLSYVPACLVWGESATYSGSIILQRISNAASFSDMWIASMDSTNLYIDNGMDNSKNAYYYIFYDNIT